MAEKQLKSIKFTGLEDTYVLPEIDDSLSTSGKAADAKATGDALALKAPAGFGLGETQSRLLELEDIDGTRTNMIPAGWYHLDPTRGGITIDGYTMNPVGIRVEPYTKFGMMTITIIYYGRPVISRAFIQGSWQPWEWLIPPMMAGVEYRTMQRIDGKAVYKKKVDGEIFYRLDGETEWKNQNGLVGAAAKEDLDDKVDRENGEAYWLNVRGLLNLMQSDQTDGVYFNPGLPGDSIVLEMLGTYQDEPVILRGLGQPEDGNDAVPLDYADGHYAPSGYGLGKGGKAIPAGDNLNNYKVGGWYQFTKGVTNAPCDYGMMMVIPGTGYANDTYQYVFSRYPAYKLYIRQLFEGTWQAWADISPSAFAPSGYGYGGTAINLGKVTSESELDAALATVYDAMGNNETKMITFTHYPSSSDWRWFGILSKSTANNGSLVAHSAYNGGSKIIKQKNSGSWVPCEWENPPLAPNTEYRTMMRWNSKPVYVKRIVKSFSNTIIGAATGYSDYDITHGVSGLTTLVRLEGTMDDKIILPYLAGAGGHTFLLQDTGTAIRLRIYCDTWSNPTVSITMYYTK